MTFKQLYLRALPVLIAAPIACLYLMGTSDYEDLLYIEQLKQEQRDYIRASSTEVQNAYLANPLGNSNARSFIYSVPPSIANHDSHLSTQKIKLIAKQ